MKSLQKIFKETFADKKLSSAEKKAVGAVLEERALSDADLAVLRSYIFKVAKDDLNSYSTAEVLEWLEKSNKLLVKKQAGGGKPIKTYFSPGDECRNAINYELKRAKKSVKICVFTISDNHIADEIVEAHKRGVKVQIITDDDKSLDRGSDIAYFHRKGIAVKMDDTPNHMHHKFALFDDETLITGSYNWTRSAAMSNHENIVVIQNPKTIKAFDKEFKKLWKEFHSYK